MRNPKTWRAWTRKEEARLADLRARGFTIARCAEELGRPAASVRCRLQVIEAPKHNHRQTEYMHALTRPGLTNRQVAELLGVKRHTVIVMKKRIRRRMSRGRVA